MAKLLWDQVGEHLYEAGLDRGVLYLAENSGVAWSGLTGVDEDFGDDKSSPFYFDGDKYLDNPSIGDFAAKLTAITYPDEFLEYEGTENLGNGLLVGDQAPKMFGLSYRTLIGNDSDGLDHGYKLHILYNLSASQSQLSHDTLRNSTDLIEFTWDIASIPMEVKGYRPTAHIIFDSTLMEESMLNGIEQILYGGQSEDPRLPTINELLDLVAFWDPRIIIPNTVTGLAQLQPGLGDLTPSTIPGIYTPLPDGRLEETAVEGVYQLI